MPIIPIIRLGIILIRIEISLIIELSELLAAAKLQPLQKGRKKNNKQNQAINKKKKKMKIYFPRIK